MVLQNIQIITICVNYTDFFKYTYKHNIQFFNPENYHIITDESDIETINFCKDNNHTSVEYFDFFNKSHFNKSGAIYSAQQKLHKEFPNDWILLLDADILLPNNFETYFINKCNNKEAMYSMKRKDYEHKEDFELNQNLKDYGGITFMGYMQLYFDKTKFYDSYSNDCCTGDTFFRDKFYSTLTLLDDNDYVIHLGPERINSRGRKSEKW